MAKMTWKKVFRENFCRRTEHGWVVYNSIRNTEQIERFIKSLLHLAFYGVRDISEPHVTTMICRTCASKSDRRYCHYGMKMANKKTCKYYYSDENNRLSVVSNVAGTKNKTGGHDND
jgi:hypothetical protein